MTERRRVLVLNAGSATLKATVLDRRRPSRASTGRSTGRSTARAPGARARSARSSRRCWPMTVAPASVDAVGHRVVHGGERFAEPTRIDDDALAALDGLADLAPLHNPGRGRHDPRGREMLAGMPHVAVFDTAFHATLPEAGRRYPVPDEWVTDHGVRRYGFHGLSVDGPSAARVSCSIDLRGRPAARRRAPRRWLLGDRPSTDGRSVDTSMGLTPLEGLMMGTRAGSIDPGDRLPAPPRVALGRRHRAGARGRVRAARRRRHRRHAPAAGLGVRRRTIGRPWRSSCSCVARRLASPPPRRRSMVSTPSCSRAASASTPPPSDADLRAAPPDRHSSPGARRADRGRRRTHQSGPAVLVVHAREDVVIADAALAVVRR